MHRHHKHQIHPSSNQKGMALITVLLFLAVTTVLGITTATTSLIENYIARNYRSAKVAFFNAEAGVHYAFAKIRADSVDISSCNPSFFEEYTNHAPGPFSFELTYGETVDEVCYFLSTGYDPEERNARAKIRIGIRFKEVLNPLYKIGIISDGDISLTSLVRIDGSMHSNGSVYQSGGGTLQNDLVTGSVTAVGTVGMNISKDSQSAVSLIDIPKVDAFKKKTQADITYEADQLFYGKKEFTSSDNDFLKNRIIFVDGDIIIKNNTELSNTTIIATGNVEFYGSATSNDQEINNAIIANGKIEYRGSENMPTYAVFWSNGSFFFRGGSTIYGSIMTAGYGSEVFIAPEDYSDDSTVDSLVFNNLVHHIDNPILDTVPDHKFFIWSDQSLL
jgi:hypothetical protein